MPAPHQPPATVVEQTDAEREEADRANAQELGAVRDEKGWSTARSMLEHLKDVPMWAGDDLEERLAEVYRLRGTTEF